MKRIFIVAIVVIAFGVAGFTNLIDAKTKVQSPPANIQNSYEPFVVLELFTSQGCSSCPSADRLLDEMKKLHPKNVFTLSYHVDYWNYIGWDDPFSSAEHAVRQRAYNEKFRYRGNYTPEVVVNGKLHFTGSDRAKMNAAIQLYGQEMVSNKVAIIKSELLDGTAIFQYVVEGNLEDKSMRAILVLDERTTEVKSGENRNRSIKNSNIVIAEEMFLLNENTGNGEISIPTAVLATDTLQLMLMVENNVHDITAAAKATFGAL